jgi:hypothetical protein
VRGLPASDRYRCVLQCPLRSDSLQIDTTTLVKFEEELCAGKSHACRMWKVEDRPGEQPAGPLRLNGRRVR